MKVFCCMVATVAVLMAIPATAAELHNDGVGTTNIWSSTQGTSDSYGAAKGFSTSSSGSLANAGGRGSTDIGGGFTDSITTSHSIATTSGSGYAQTQTSGYAGGSVSGFAARSH
jgi:hypothetical protein